MDEPLRQRYRDCLEVAGLTMAALAFGFKVTGVMLDGWPAKFSVSLGPNKRSKWLSDILRRREPLGLRRRFLAIPPSARGSLMNRMLVVLLAPRETRNLGDPLGLLANPDIGVESRAIFETGLASFSPALVRWRSDIEGDFRMES